MANTARRLAENVPGDFYVDDSCIDCDACRQIAPTVFRDHGEQSSVFHQPETDDDAARYGVEHIIEGADAVRLDRELVVIPTPGHTRGHAVLLYKDKYLFTGDHLAWSPTRETLTAFRSACWYSWPVQTRSMERLLDYSFEWVLPGHGRIHHDTAEGMRG